MVTQLESLATTGLLIREAGGWITRELSVSGKGLALENGAGLAGNPTFALADDLKAIEALNGLGFAVRTGTDAWSQREFKGVTNRISVDRGDGRLGHPVIDIAPTYEGQTSITKLGTVTTGAWNATTVAVGYGGTGISSYVLGDTLYASGVSALTKLAGNITSTRKFMRQTGNGVISAVPVWDTLLAGDIPNLSASYDVAGAAASAQAAAIAASQPLNVANLSAIAGLTTTAFGRGLLTLTDAVALRAALASNQSALATNATDGFLYVPICEGSPTGTPTAFTGLAPVIIDSTNNKLYFFSGGTWRDAGP